MKKEDVLALIEKTKDLKLLYVEDDEFIAQNTITILNKFFHNMVFAKNGEEGLEKFKEGGVDLIITDINMPLMGGIEMLEKIREIDTEVSAVLVTAHNEQKFKDAVEKLDAKGYLLKPIRLDNLFSKLQDIVGIN